MHSRAVASTRASWYRSRPCESADARPTFELCPGTAGLPPTIADDDKGAASWTHQENRPITPIDDDRSRLRAACALLLPFARHRVADARRSAATELHADFVAQHPHSAWTPGLELDLGAVYRHTGHFSKALSTWRSAWEASKDLTSADGHIVGDMAAAYLSQFEAYLGRKESLAPLLEELKTRSVRGTAAELVSESSRGLAEMETRPDVAFKCGPSALLRILRQSPTPDAPASRRVLSDAKSTPNGLSLDAVQAISVEAGMSYQMAHRSPGAPLLMPAVTHWKVGHYAALLGRDARDHLLVADATFGEDIVLTPSTFDEEASGYFLVPRGPLPEGWRQVGAEEGSAVWGRGDTGGNHDNGATGRLEKQAFECNGKPGGCTRWNVEASVGGLELRDDPVGYTPPFGPEIRFPMTYSHRDVQQPSKFTYTNFGDKWTFGWLSYIVDQSDAFYAPSQVSASLTAGFGQVVPVNRIAPASTEPQPITWENINVQQDLCADLYRQGGGDEPYVFPTLTLGQPQLTAQTSVAGQFSQAYLKRNVDANGNPISFIRTLPDGSVEKFTLPQGPPNTGSQKFFMTEIDDPQGNAVMINFDSQMRITSVMDAAGQSTTICYNDSGAPCVTPNSAVNPPSNLQVTEIVDPFGRFATFGYDPSTGHLTSITDVLGITSQYQYNAPTGSASANVDFVNTLTTPYGTTTFAYTDSTNLPPNDTSRSLTATEVSALGNVPQRTSRVEFFQGSLNCHQPAPTAMFPNGTQLDTSNIECTDGMLPGTQSLSISSAQIPVFNTYLQFRNTFIWNPEQYQTSYGTPNQYLGAKLIHWLHTDDDSNSLTAGRVPESVKEPLETRVWFNYPGQSANAFAYSNSIGVGASNQPSAIVRAVGDGSFQAWQYQYDNYGHVTQSIDPLGRTLSMTYDPTNNVDLLTVTNTTSGRNDSLLTLANYVQHRPQQVTGANGQVTQLRYDAVGQLVSSTDPLSNVWTYTYTPTTGGFLTGIVGPAVPVPPSQGGGEQIPSYSFTYDNVGRLFTEEGPDALMLSFFYDDADRLTATIFPDETWELRGYTTASGAPMLDLQSFTDRAGNTTSRLYDGFREVTEIDEPAGRTTKLSYWPDGTVQSVTDPLKHITNYTRDAQGRLQFITNPDNSTQFYAYDAVGRVTSTSPYQQATGFGAFQYAYNLDNTVATAFLDWRAPTVFTYDPAYPRLSGWYRIQGGTWAQPKCASGSTCAALDQESYTYYPVGTDGANKLETVVTAITPLTTTATGPTTATLSYGYDPLDRVTSKDISTGPIGWQTVNAAESLYYDAIGRLTNDANLLDSFIYTYSDATARISGRTSEGGPQIAASYFPPPQDGLLQQLSYTAPSGSALAQYNYGYDALHNVTSISDSNIGTASYAYDAYSQLNTATYSGYGSPTLTAVPDVSGNISSLSIASTYCGPPHFTLTGPVSSCSTHADSLASFQYDSANKMTQETTTGAAGSPTIVQPVAVDSVVGSLRTVGAGATGRGYYYDDSNRLESYTVGTAWPYNSSLFAYDGLGRLSQVVEEVPETNSTLSTPVASHSYIWCGQRRCLEIDNMQQVAIPGSTQTTGLPDALYLAQGAVNNPIPDGLPSEPSGITPSQLAYDITDLLGSERAVVTNNAMVALYDYDAFGNRTTVSGSSTASKRGFTGLYYHTASGLQFARNRAYDSSLGRWMTRDPIGIDHAFDDPERFNATDLNLYAYAGNNPQSMVDPSGNDPLAIGVWFAAGGETAGAAVALPFAVIAATGYAVMLGIDAYFADLAHQQGTITRPYPSGDGTTPPEEGWEWRGPDSPGGERGGWVNPANPGESLHPDLDHPEPEGPHWDWNLPGKRRFRLFPDGRTEPKGGKCK